MEAGTQEQLIRKWTEVAHPGRVLQAVPPGVARAQNGEERKGRMKGASRTPMGPSRPQESSSSGGSHMAGPESSSQSASKDCVRSFLTRERFGASWNTYQPYPGKIRSPRKAGACFIPARQG